MANEKNLIPAAHKLTVEEASRGGKNSAKKRRAIKSFREAAKKILEMEVDAVHNGELVKITAYEGLVFDLYKQAKDKNDKDHLQALQMLLELSGQSARQMEIELKRDELKLKKDIADNNNW